MGNVTHETQMVVLSTVVFFCFIMILQSHRAMKTRPAGNWKHNICVTVSCPWRQRNQSIVTHLLTSVEPTKQDRLRTTCQCMLLHLRSINTVFVVSNRRRTIFCLGNSWPIPSQGRMCVSKDDGLCSDIENEFKGPILLYFSVSSLCTSSPKTTIPLLLL